MKIGQLEIDLLANVARLQADMNEVKRSVGGSMAYVQQAADMAKTAMIGLVGIGSVAAFAGMVRSSIEGAAALNDLSIQTGISVEQLSALASVGKTTGTSAETIANAANKMAKTLAGASEESKGAGAALKAMGINFNDFVQLSPDQQMIQLAQTMDKFADGSGKSAAAQALLGKEGAKLLPFLKDLAMTGELHAKVTAEQAAQADQFSDNLTMLQASGEGWKKELSMGMLPALSLASQAVLDVMNGTGGLRDEVKKLSADGSLKAWTFSAIEGFTYLVDAGAYLKRALVTLGAAIGALVAQGVQLFGGLGDAMQKVMVGDFSGAVESIKGGYNGMRTVMESFGQEQAAAWGEQTLGSKIRERMVELKAMGTTAEAAKPKVDMRQQLDGNAASAKKAADEYGKLIDKLNGQIAAGQMQLAQGDKLSAAQKESLELMVRLRDGTLKLSDSQKLELVSKLELLRANELHIDAMGDEAKLQADIEKDRQAVIDAVGKQTAAYQEQLEKEREELLHLQLGDAAYRQLTITRQYDLAAQIESIAATSDQSEALMNQVRIIRERAALMEKGDALKEAQAVALEWKKTTDQIENGLTDSLMRAFESGKGFADAFKDTLVNAFKSMVLKPIIQPIVNAAGQGLQSLFGGASSMLGGVGSGLSSFASSGYMGLILAGMMASSSAYDMGYSQNNLKWGQTWAATGGIAPPSLKFDTNLLEKLGVSSKTANIITGASLWSRLANWGAGTPHVGAMLNMDQYGNYTSAPGQAAYTKADAVSVVSSIGSSALEMLNGMSKQFGLGGGYSGRFGFKADNSDPAYAYLSIINAAGKQMAGWTGTGDKWGLRDYVKDPKASMESYTNDVATAIKSTMEAMNLPKWAKATLDAMGDSTTMDALSAAVEQIAAVNAQITSMGEAFNPLGGIFTRIAAQSSDAQYQLAMFSGGIDKLMANAQTFASTYYGTDEQQGIQAASLLAQFKALGIDAMPTTLSEFRKLVEGQNLQTEEGRLRVAALLEMSGQFASVQEYLTQQGTTLETLAKLAPQGAVFDELTNAQKRQADAAAAQADMASRQAAAAESTAASIVTLADLLGSKLDTLTTTVSDGLARLRQDMYEA